MKRACPHPLTRQMLVGKKLGRKVGGGFYQYKDGQKQSRSSMDLKSLSTLSDVSNCWFGLVQI